MSRRRRPSRRALSGGAGLLAIGLALAAAVWVMWTWQGPGPQAVSGRETTVVLPRGAGVGEIARTLEDAKVIGSSTVFVLAARLTGASGALKAGEYAFPSGASMARVLDDIRDGRVVRHFVTIPEGWTSAMAVDALRRHPVLTGEVEVPPEGVLLPDTYQVQRGDTRASVIARMRRDQAELVETLWAKRQPGLPIATPEEAVILASIVEKETAVASERPRVAAVFVNRLRRGMRLESDPTIIYGITEGRPLGRRIRASEIAAATPYNTYAIDGLPPTPIANPGREAIAAVLNPPTTEDIFFVADGTGGHAFSTNYPDHQRRVARWREIERQRLAAEAAE